ncbi:autotransporter beta-domain protein [Collimonas fungivorans]|uniref:Autotransporter beta-domain protein n=1 Tax=Collimonas fungivorans TaxID=158899 RepID=A0A127P829_9BURK|nr:autotransporter serine protease [Collimonas fungivorans]AMO93979.1 autotransporter beta-domain protein [Collimonas fungivorans]
MNKELSAGYSLSVIAMAVSVMISGCGGGGGGSSNPSPPAPAVPTTPPVVTPPAPDNNSGNAITPPVVTPPVLPPPMLNVLDPSNLQAARAQGMTGAGVTVGVVDTDFDVSDTQLAGRISKTVYSSGGANGNMHGTEVAQALAGSTLGVAPGVFVQAAAAGTTGNSLLLNNQIYQDLFAKGVRIFNQSNGISATGASVGQALALHGLYQPYVAQQGLFIWSTGNDGAAQPNLNASLPSLFGDLQSGWLAVTAVNAAGGSNGYSASDTVPGVISSYANRCGVAANWCLAAAGDFISSSSGTRVFGTSFAAPAVSGAAALVQQAYPWMNADLIRQTILSTATDMHYTATYGWGLLNASKAVNGPALFDARLALGPNVNIAFDNVSSVFKNDIGGDAGLNKSGSGQLTLAGANTYQGASNVLGGRLNITGSVASSVNVSALGRLGGDGGRIHGNVNNNGRVDNSGAGLTIAGNYVATPGAVLANQLNSSLTVGGAAILGNSHLVATTPGGSTDPSGYVTQQVGVSGKVLTAAGGVSGQFSEVSFEADGVSFTPGVFIAANLSYQAREVDLHISRTNVATMAAAAFKGDATRNNAAANLETGLQAADQMVASGKVTGTNGTFLASAAALQKSASVAVAGQVLDSLSGQIHASAQALTFQQSQTLNRDLGNRLAALGNQAEGQDGAGLWVSAIGASGKLNQSGYASGDTSLWGGQFGVDTRLGTHTIVGAALAYADSKASFDRLGGQGKGHSTGVSLYGRHGFGDGGAYVSGRAGVASIDSTVTRTALIGNTEQDLGASHTDSLWSAYMEGGYGLPLSADLRLTPYAGLAYDRLKRGGFTESGGVFGLTAESQVYKQTAGLLGVRGESRFQWAGGMSVLQAYAAWQHAFSEGSLDFGAAYVGAPAARFTVQGIGLARSSGWAGLGLSTTVDSRWGWYLNYDAQLGNGGLRNNMLALGLRFRLD